MVLFNLKRFLVFILLTVLPFYTFAYDAEDAIQIQSEIMNTCMSQKPVDDQILSSTPSLYYSITSRPEGCYPDELTSASGSILDLIHTEKERSLDFMKDITDLALREIVAEYYMFEKRFGNENVSAKNVEELCKVPFRENRYGKSPCTTEIEEYLKGIASEYIQEISLIEKEKRISIDKMIKTLNARIDFLNIQLSKINKKGIESVDDGLFSTKAKMSIEVQKLYDDYYLACWENLSSSYGKFLNSPYFVNVSGMCKLKVDDKQHGMNEAGDNFYFTKHKRIKKSDYTKGVISIRKMYSKNLRKAIKDYRLVQEKAIRLNEIDKVNIVKSQILENRSGLAESLLVDPYQASLVCEASKSFANDKQNRKYLETGTNVIMGVSTLFGVGSLAGLTVGFVSKMMLRSALKKSGKILLTKKTSRKLYGTLGRSATAEKFFRVSTTMAGVSSTLALVESPFLFNIYMTEKENLVSFQESVFRYLLKDISYNKSLVNAHKMKVTKLFKKVQDYKFKSILNAVFIPLNVGAMGIAISQLKSLGSVKAETMDTFARLLNTSELSVNEISQFINRFKKLSQADAAKFVNILNQSQLDEQLDMIKLIQSADKISQNSSNAKKVNQVNAVKVAANINTGMKQFQMALKAAGATPAQSLQFLRYLKYHKLNNKELALKLVQGLAIGRLTQTSKSPMFLAYAIRTFSNVSSRDAIAAEKLLAMINHWSDTMISGLSFTYRRAEILMSKNKNLTKEQAITNIMKSDGLSSSDIFKLKNCTVL
ncbi:MAG: hypothetical protein HON90_11390 [Halobacteriovoraceae bacterium]|jgi:hypothetical protein|nr:hypothetical protein [Halobacteriovoraceae bacterium]